MSRLRLILPMMVLVLVGGWLIGDDPKDPPVKVKGKLPAPYKKLGLSDDQIQSVYKIQAKFNGQIDQLSAKIAQLKKDEKSELEKLLTAAQKARLREILLGEMAEVPKDKDEKKEPPKDKEKDK
jgi:hypothetical protein